MWSSWLLHMVLDAEMCIKFGAMASMHIRTWFIVNLQLTSYRMAIPAIYLHSKAGTCCWIISLGNETLPLVRRDSRAWKNLLQFLKNCVQYKRREALLHYFERNRNKMIGLFDSEELRRLPTARMLQISLLLESGRPSFAKQQGTNMSPAGLTSLKRSSVARCACCLSRGSP